MVSPWTSSPSSSYKLQCPLENGGCDNKDALAVGWSGRVAVKDALPSW